LQLISRRYARGDLKPKAYAYVTTRILIVAVLSWALELFYKGESNTLLLAAFLIGIVPKLSIDAVPSTFEGKLAWAGQLESSHRYKEAIQVLHEAIEIHDDAVARLQLAHLYIDAPVGSLRDLGRSREHAKRALDLGAGDFDVMNGLAEIYEKQGDMDDAIAATERAIHLFGDAGSDAEKKKTLEQLRKKRAALQDRKQTQT
jgi:tetratricopeptide (TPR) repeat protein